MLEPSPRLKKEAKRLGCDPNHIILADLILCGYSEAEAYSIAYSENALMSAKERIARRENELSSEKYKRAYDEKRKTRAFISEDVEDRGKEDVLRELNRMATQERDTKMKSELLMKIAEIKQMKKDITSDSEDPVQFFLPLSCEKCPLLVAYNEYITKKNEGKPQEKWDNTVRPDEMQRLIERADDKISRERQMERNENRLG